MLVLLAVFVYVAASNDAEQTSIRAAFEGVTVTPGTSAMEALQPSRQHGVDRLSVVQNRDEIVGVVSRTDLMTAFDTTDSTGPPTTLTDRTAIQV